jgi:hypothetical protein
VRDRSAPGITAKSPIIAHLLLPTSFCYVSLPWVAIDKARRYCCLDVNNRAKNKVERDAVYGTCQGQSALTCLKKATISGPSEIWGTRAHRIDCLPHCSTAVLAVYFEKRKTLQKSWLRRSPKGLALPQSWRPSGASLKITSGKVASRPSANQDEGMPSKVRRDLQSTCCHGSAAP